MNFKNIAISGDIGTGKSTLGKKLAEKLNWKYLSAGDYFRKWHEDNNVDLEDPEEIPEEIDRKIDYSFRDQMKDTPNIIFESRLAGWLAKDYPQTFKILCTTQLTTAMERVAKRDRQSIEQATAFSKERSQALEEKFKKLYDVDNYLDPKYFDLVIDTTNLNPEQVLEKVLENLG